MFGDDLRSLVRICGYCYLWVRLGLLVVPLACGFAIAYCWLLVTCFGFVVYCSFGCFVLGFTCVWFACQVWCWA